MKLTKEQQELVDKLHSLTIRDCTRSANITDWMNSEAGKEQLKENGRRTIRLLRERGHDFFGHLTFEQRSEQGKKNAEIESICPHCAQEGKSHLFINRHIKRCPLRSITLDEFIQEWNTPTMHRDDFAKKLGNDLGALKNMVEYLTEIGYDMWDGDGKCPHCYEEGNFGDLQQAHYHACWFHPDRFNKDAFIVNMGKLSTRALEKRYGIPRARIMRYIRYINKTLT